MERMFKQDGRLVFHKQTDPTPVLDNVQALRGSEVPQPVDGVHVARIDAHVLELWLKEAGVKFDDRNAVREVIRKKIISSDNAAFRVWEGNF